MKLSFSDMNRYAPDLRLWTRLPALAGWCGLSFGIWMSASLIPFIPSLPAAIYVTGSILLIALVCVSVLISHNLLRCILFGITGVLVFQLNVSVYSKKLDTLSSLAGTDLSIVGTVVSNPSLSGTTFRFQFRTDTIYSNATSDTRRYRLICQGPIAPIYGSRIALKGTVTCPVRTRMPYIFNDFDYQFSIGTHGRLTFDTFDIVQSGASGFLALNKRFRSHVLDVIEHFKQENHRAILRAAFLGENTFLSDELKSTFRKSGIIHLLSISGLHAGMLIAAAYFLLHFLPINTTIKHSIVLAILWTYQILIGWLPSLLRATIMATIVISALFFEKKRYALQSIGIAGIVLLIIFPGILFNPGYQLSFGATAGIIILYPRLALLKPRFSPALFSKLLDYTLSSFFVSFAGFVSTAPILAFHFGTLSCIGLIVNIAAVFIMTSAMWLFFLSLLLQQVFPFAVFALSTITAAHFTVLENIAAVSGSVPYSELILPVPGPEMMVLYVVILLIAGTIDKQHLKRFITLILPAGILIMSLLVIFRYARNAISIIRIATPTSACTAIRTPSGAVWIIPDRSVPARLPHDIIDNWLRQFPKSHIEKVLLFTNESSEDNSSRHTRKRQYGSVPDSLPYVKVTHPIDTTIVLRTLLRSHDCTLSLKQTSPQEPRLHIKAGTCDYSMFIDSTFQSSAAITTAHIRWNWCGEKTYR